MTSSLFALSKWLERQLRESEYADITLRFKVHSGNVTIVERTVSEKLKLSTLANNGDKSCD